MENYRDNRVKLAEKFIELGEKNPYKTNAQFNNDFESEEGILNLIDNIQTHFNITWTKEQFVKKFTCDKDAFKNSQYCSSSSQPIDTINPIFSCIEKKEEKDGTKITRGKNFIMFKADEKTFWAFNKYKKWQQIVGGKVVHRGSWLCNGDSEYFIYSGDEVYSSKIYRWVPYSGPQPDDKKPSSPKPTWKETTLTIEDLKNGKTVSIGMKGDVIGEIQKLLISAGYKEISKSGEPDNLFGRLTKTQVKKFQSENKDDKGEQLKDDGIVGTKTINALLKKSDEKMKSSAQAETPQKLRLAGKEFGQIPTPPREQIPSINLPDRNKIQLPNVPGVKTK
jgi:hypothetical protein